jgi:regulatory protein YycI of two-component signal transduction system YycFG
MDWEKAKNYTIIFLLLLDLFLGALVLMERDQYVMDAKKTKAIVDLLELNNIHVKTEVPRVYRPMYRLAMSSYTADEGELIEVFFPEMEPERIVYPDKIINQIGNSVLTIQNGFISFDCPQGMGDLVLLNSEALNDQNAVKLTNKFISGMGDNFSRFSFDRVFPIEDGYLIQYYQKFSDYYVFTNFVEFIVTNNGIIRVDCVYSDPLGNIGQEMEICSADEALLNFMQQSKSAYGDRSMNVTKIDLVYMLQEGTAMASDSLKASPYYRIEMENLESPFMISAYINLN